MWPPLVFKVLTGCGLTFASGLEAAQPQLNLEKKMSNIADFPVKLEGVEVLDRQELSGLF